MGMTTFYVQELEEEQLRKAAEEKKAETARKAAEKAAKTIQPRTEPVVDKKPVEAKEEAKAGE